MKITRTQLREMIQERIRQMTEADDSFSKAGKEIEKSAQEFARKVLANTDEYDTKNVRQASFAKGAKTVADKK